MHRADGRLRRADDVAADEATEVEKENGKVIVPSGSEARRDPMRGKTLEANSCDSDPLRWGWHRHR